MNRRDAQYFARLMEDYLDIPSFICEAIEEAIINGEYRKIVEYIVDRRRAMALEDHDGREL